MDPSLIFAAFAHSGPAPRAAVVTCMSCLCLIILAFPIIIVIQVLLPAAPPPPCLNPCHVSIPLSFSLSRKIQLLIPEVDFFPEKESERSTHMH